jgi:hypothetical protein
MPVNSDNSHHHGRGNYVTIIWCPSHVGARFAHFDRNLQTGGWVIRDYVTRRQLSNKDSQLTIAQIEEATQRDEFPPFHQYSQIGDWEIYLRLRSKTVAKQHRLRFSTAAPNPASGNWRRL